jgi:2-(1,2-epoxy-1,2-dihydrophenyl)acetyl-CoA isomerase
MNDCILFTVTDRVGTVTFNRPHALNAMDLAMGERLRLLAAELPTYTDLRVLVLRGAGNAFMAGGDIQCFSGSVAQVTERLSTLIDGFNAFVMALYALPIPVIAAVRGPAAGAGFSLAIGADITIAADNAQFVPAYRTLGATPDGGGSYFLRRLLGRKRALEVLLAAKSIPAVEALRLGLVNRVVLRAELDDVLATLIKTLSANAPVATAAIKRLIQTDDGKALAEHLAREKAAFLTCAKTHDFAEGVAAFLDKRPPKFG